MSYKMKSLIVFSLVFLSITNLIGCKDAATVGIKNLSCEDLKNPQGIDAKNPRLSWQLESDQRGQKQTASVPIAC